MRPATRLLGLAFLASSACGDPSAVLQPGLLKLRPGGTPAAPLTSISAAANEYESFQVLIVADGAADTVVESVDISIDSGDAASPSILSLVHRELYLNVTTVSDCDGALGLWPDALVPAVDPFYNETRNALPYRVAAAASQAFWIDLFVPPGTAPALHNATVRVQLQGEPAPRSLPLQLEVFNFTLPSTSSRYATTVGLSGKGILMGKYLDKVPGNVSAAERIAERRRYVQLGLMHRLTLNQFLEDSIADLGKHDAAGNPTPDWGAVEADWGSLMHGGADLPFGLRGATLTSVQLPAVHYGERGGKVNLSAIDEQWRATGCSTATPQWGYAYWWHLADRGAQDMMIYCDAAAHDPDPAHSADPRARTCGPLVNETRGCVLQHPTLPPLNNTNAITYWRSAAAHARQAGWFDKLFDYTCDEPNADPTRYAACKAHGGALHEADPTLRSLITTERPSADADNITSMIDIWVPIVNFMDSSQKLCPKYAELRVY